MRLIKHPVLCNYYVTYRCNATCSFCDIWERPSPYITLEDAEDNFRDLKRLGVKVIDFTGGEPLLHRKLPDLLALAKKMGFITTVTTNALLYPKYAKALAGKIDMLHFSLDYADKEKHDTTRGVACYDFVIESIKVAKALGERPDILFTVMKENLAEIEKVYADISLPNDLVLILNPVFEYNDLVGDGGLSPDDLTLVSQFGKRKNVYLNQAFIDLRLDGGNQTDSPVCKAMSSTVVISPENKLVAPCYHLGLEEIPIEGKLYDVYRSDKVKRHIAEEGRWQECQGCAINCYMQPSFAVEFNKYWWKALPSTLKYNLVKGTWKAMI